MIDALSVVLSRTSSLVTLGVLIVLAVLGYQLAARSVTAQPHVIGEWSTLPYPMPVNPIHAVLLRTGKVLVVAGSENDPTQTTYRAAVWDPRSGAIAVQEIPWDLFCNAITHLPDGRVLVAGGTLQYRPDFLGLRTTAIFDPVTERFIQVHDMAHGRWYPSSVVLDDGGTLIFSGQRETNPVTTNDAVEIYDVPWGWSPEYTAPFTPPLYPWLHLLPDGRVFFSGPTGDSHVLDPVRNRWTLNVAHTTHGGERRYGSPVLLPLDPARDYEPRIMIMGGGNNATAGAEIIAPAAPHPAWRALPPMSAPRIDMNAVLLPTGTVLALGGSAHHLQVASASLVADLFDPETETWGPAGVMSFPRLYHSTALLLPDATVMAAGSNPSPGVWEPRVEIYAPAYLFTTDAQGRVVRAPRPSITSAPARIGYGAAFQVGASEPSDIASAVLVRPSATTHAIDMEQRLVRLSFSSDGAALTVMAPPTSRIAPPGYYMLFLLDRRGVPSEARFLQLTPEPVNEPPRGTIVSPAADLTIGAGQSVRFTGRGTDSDGTVTGYSWLFPGGEPSVKTTRTPGTVVFATPGKYTVSLTVVDDRGTNDPSPPTRTITVVPVVPDLIETSVSDPPSFATRGTSFPVTDTVANRGTKAGATVTRYFLSRDESRGDGDLRLGGSRSVPALASGATSTGTVSVKVPSSTAPGSYFLIACADDTGAVAESSETNNCVTAPAPVEVQALRPDLVVTALGDPPATVARGARFPVTDTTSNPGTATAPPTRTRYYLSVDGARNGSDTRLTGRRDVPSLAAGAASQGSTTVTVPTRTVPGSYLLLACADDGTDVTELAEANNCHASATRVEVR